MDSNRSRTGMLFGLGAAAGAFGVAAMTSAATEPSARADAYTEIVSNVDADFAAGQTEFGIAETDFGSGDVNDGLAALFAGVNDDLVGAPDNVLVGTVDAFTGAPVVGSWTFEPSFINNFSLVFFDVAKDLSIARADEAAALLDLQASSFALGLENAAMASEYSSVLPLEALVEGAVASL
jgi:hypothetical protein